MSPNVNAVEQLIEIQKKNQDLLKIIAESQTLILELEKEKKVLEKRKIWFGVARYLFWILAIWASFVFTQKLTGSLLGGLSGNGMGNFGNSTANISEMVGNLLNGGDASEVQAELNKYFGN